MTVPWPTCANCSHRHAGHCTRTLPPERLATMTPAAPGPASCCRFWRGDLGAETRLQRCVYVNAYLNSVRPPDREDAR